MNTGEPIRAEVRLPCSIRQSGSDLRVVGGTTEELTRESIVVIAPSTGSGKWLRPFASVFIMVELPFAGAVEPRVLECAVSVVHVSDCDNGVRIEAEIQRMTVVGRPTERRKRNRSVTHSCAAEIVPAVTRSQSANPVILMNRRTNIKSNQTGENTMSFLKNFFNEEDGQDMVEYGLVMALVVVGAAAGYTAFQVQITNALTALGNTIAAKF